MICFDHFSHLPSTPHKFVPTNPFSFVHLLFWSLVNVVCTPIYSWICGLLLELGWSTRGHPQRELTLLQQLSVASSSSARGGILCLPSLFMMAFDMVRPSLVLYKLCQLLWVHTYSCPAVSKRHFSCSHLPPTALLFFCFLFHNNPQVLRREGVT